MLVLVFFCSLCMGYLFLFLHFQATCVFRSKMTLFWQHIDVSCFFINSVAKCLVTDVISLFAFKIIVSTVLICTYWHFVICFLVFVVLVSSLAFLPCDLMTLVLHLDFFLIFCVSIVGPRFVFTIRFIYSFLYILQSTLGWWSLNLKHILKVPH